MLQYIITNINNIVFISIYVVLFFVIEIYFRSKTIKLKEKIEKKYSEEDIEDIENIEMIDQNLYIKYYKVKNILHFIRFIAIFWIIIFLILSKIPGIFNFLAIAIWAIIITFKEPIVSFLWFFYVSTHLKIWENIVINNDDNTKWEIIYINILNVWLIWKNENWEHNWQFYTIPNYKFIVENVKKEDLNITTYRKEDIDIYYNRDLFILNFNDFLIELNHFLNDILVIKNLSNVWHYKTFIWYKYKMRFRYEKEYLIIKISIIEKHRAFLWLQREIIKFIETYKKDGN